MRTAILAALIALTAFTSTGRAGTAVRLEIEGLVQNAELVFEGRVVTSRSMKTPEGRVETEFFVAVQRTFLGLPLGTRTFRMPGGTLADGSGMVVPGMPVLREGETALFFLTEAGAGGWRVPVGLAQGKLDVVVGFDGRRALRRSGAPLNLVDPLTGQYTPIAEGALLEYDETLLRIENAVSRKLLGLPAAEQSLEGR